MVNFEHLGQVFKIEYKPGYTADGTSLFDLTPDYIKNLAGEEQLENILKTPSRFVVDRKDMNAQELDELLLRNTPKDDYTPHALYVVRLAAMLEAFGKHTNGVEPGDKWASTFHWIQKYFEKK